MPINQRNAGFISATYQPLQVANAPTIGAATAGDTSADVAFTAPANVGGSAISAYYAVSDPDRVTVSGASSPITVTGLTNGTAYTFSVWALNTYGPSPFSGASGSVTPVSPTGLFLGGRSSGVATNVIDYIIITTTGNATDFGDLTLARATGGACSSSTRGIFGGGINLSNIIEYVTISSAGNAIDFGDLLSATGNIASCSSSTRGIFAGGSVSGIPSINVIQYITIASVGNATDFGDLGSTQKSMASCASSTRGIFAGGSYNDDVTNSISYITIASVGNATDFGDLTFSTLTNADSPTGCSNATRGLIFMGADGSVSEYSNVINYITIATTGNALDFGDLPVQAQVGGAACASSLRGVIGGGENGSSSSLNVINYVTIATTGNALDFGDLTLGRKSLASCSNCHGGL
jgi:hypothetical protein